MQGCQPLYPSHILDGYTRNPSQYSSVSIGFLPSYRKITGVSEGNSRAKRCQSPSTKLFTSFDCSGVFAPAAVCLAHLLTNRAANHGAVAATPPRPNARHRSQSGWILSALSLPQKPSTEPPHRAAPDFLRAEHLFVYIHCRPDLEKCQVNLEKFLEKG